MTPPDAILWIAVTLRHPVALPPGGRVLSLGPGRGNDALAIACVCVLVAPR